MEKNISQTNLKELFTEPIFKVPRYQRPYSWDEDKVEELWEDIIYAIEQNLEPDKVPSELNFQDAHFIGMFIFSSVPKSSENNVIDGQQRLSTILILLSLIRAYLLKIGGSREDCNQLAKTIEEDFLSKTNDEGRRICSRLTLGYYDNDFFERYILCGNIDIEKNIENMNEYENSKSITSYRKILKTYEIFNVKIIDFINTFKNDEEQINGLKLLYYTTIKGLKFVYFLLDDDDKSNIIFETINSRGEQLAQADLIKNYLFSNLDNSKIDSNFEYWRKIVENVGDNNITDYIKDHYVSKYKLKKDDRIKDNLFYMVKRNIKKSELEEYFENLYKESFVYSKILNAKNNADNRIERLYYKINKLKINRIKPMLLSAHSRFKENEVNHFKCLNLINGFLFRFKIVNSNSPDNLQTKVNEISIKLRENSFEIANLKQYLNDEKLGIKNEQILTTLKNMEIKVTIRKFLFLEIENYIRKNIGNPTELIESCVDIEHILPESSIHLKNYTKFDKETHRNNFWRLGNLLLIKKKLNKKLDGKAFKEKIQILNENTNDFEVVKNFLKYNSTKDDWDENLIQNRSLHISNKILEVYSIN